MIKKLSSLQKAVKGQTIKHMVVAADHTSVWIRFTSGKILKVSGELLDNMSVPATLDLELLDA